MNLNKKDLLIYSAFLIVTLIFFYKFLTPNYVFAFKDLSRYFYPLRYLMVEQIRSGIVPLWNPYLFSGYPFLATFQIGFFYPLSLIYYLLPFNLAFNYYTIIHYFLAALFTYLLMRHYGVSRAGAFLSGIVFAFSGYLVSVANMNTTLTSVAWLPLVVLLYDRLIKQFKLGNLFLLAVSLTLMFLGGEPTVVYFTSLVLVVYGFFFGKSLKAKGQNILILLTSLFFVTLISAVQLIPFLELARFSDRAVLTDFNLISMRSLPIRETINFILPYFFGNLTKAGSYNAVLLGKKIQDWLISPYIGFIPIFFVIYSLIKTNKWIKFWGIIGVFGLLLAFGRYTPLYYLFYRFVPGASFVRYPIKYLFIPVFSIALLSGFGFDRYFSNKSDKRFVVYILCAFSFFFSMVYLFLRIFQKQVFAFYLSRLTSKPESFYLEALWNNLQFSLQSIFNLAGIVILFTLILYGVNLNKIRKEPAILIILAISLLDLFAVNVPINIPADEALYSEITPNIEFLLSDRSLFRYCLTGKMIDHNRLVFGYDYNQALLDTKDKLAANRPMIHKLYEFNGYESVILDSHRKFNESLDKLSIEERIKELGTLNVKYIISLHPLRSRNLKLLKHRADYYFGETYIYLNKYWQPRAYMISDLESISPQPWGKVEIKEYGPLSVHVLASSKRGGFLFLSDSYYPGWKAYVDGKETKIYKANYRFRAVKLNPGKHEIVFSYDPLTFKIGAFISSFTIVGLLCFGLFKFSFRKKY